MSQQESKTELEIEFEFKLGKKQIRGIFGVAEKSTVFGIEVHSSSALSPLEVEKTLYQITHLIAQKTRTMQQLIEEKKNAWN
jgi:hypothetical protein